jgi:arylsulfatase
VAATKDFIQCQNKADKPLFAWFNSTRMRANTHCKPASKRKNRFGHPGRRNGRDDGHVGDLLNLLDELKIADNTVVIYTTDNGAMKALWPDGDISPFRSQSVPGCVEQGSNNR